MYSVCIPIRVSMYLCIYIVTKSTHCVSGLAIGGAWASWSALEDANWVKSEMHLAALIKQVWRCTWWPRWSKPRDAIEGSAGTNLDMHFEAEIEWTQRCNWRLWLSTFRDAHWGHDEVNSEMELEAVIKQVWRPTCRPRSIELRDARIAVIDWKGLSLIGGIVTSLLRDQYNGLYRTV